MKCDKNGLNKIFLNYVIAYLTDNDNKLASIIRASDAKIDKFYVRQKFTRHFNLMFSELEQFEQSPIGLLFGLNGLNNNPTLGDIIIDIALYLNKIDYKYIYFYKLDWLSILDMVGCDKTLRLNKENFIRVMQRIMDK